MKVSLLKCKQLLYFTIKKKKSCYPLNITPFYFRKKIFVADTEVNCVTRILLHFCITLFLLVLYTGNDVFNDFDH